MTLVDAVVSVIGVDLNPQVLTVAFKFNLSIDGVGSIEGDLMHSMDVVGSSINEEGGAAELVMRSLPPSSVKSAAGHCRVGLVTEDAHAWNSLVAFECSNSVLHSTGDSGAIVFANLFSISACFTHGSVTGMKLREFHSMATEIASSAKALNNGVSRVTEFHMPQLPQLL